MIKQIKSFTYAFEGLKIMSKDYNFWIHFPATLFVIFLAIFLKVSSSDWLWLLLAITLVWILEIINTAIEKIVDMTHPSYGKKAGEIKDLAAAAVLVGSFFAISVAAIIFFPFISSFFA